MSEPSKPIICCGFTPCIQRIIEFDHVNKGAVNRAVNVTVGIGGKGANTARMITQLGAKAILAEFVGGENGRLLERLLTVQDVEFKHVQVAGETRICQTLVESGNPETTELVEEMPSITADDWERMMDMFLRLELTGSLVTISGKLPAGAPVDAYAQLCRLITENKGRVILDTQGAPLLRSLEFQPSIVKINDEELFQATNLTDMKEACGSLMDRGAETVLITRGKRSSFYFDADHALEITPPTIQAVNAVGSGDAVTAGLAVALTQGVSISDAIVQGMVCGAANALNLLSGFIKPDDVERLRKMVQIVSL